MLYYLPIVSNPPLGFNESSSILMSRVQHGIDFSDEIVHQLEGRYSIGSTSFLMNMSLGMRHSMEGLFSQDATNLYYDDSAEDTATGVEPEEIKPDQPEEEVSEVSGDE